jgi:chloramphenicol-sensitive protein RarD
MTAISEDKSGLAPETRGFLFALSAYLLWGVQPIYMKMLAHMPAAEVVAHRILWSVPLAGIVLILIGRTADVRKAFRSPKTLAMAALTASIITVNWGIYVWSIAADRAIEAALGYYINPLFSVFLGAVLLGERLNRLQLVSIALAVLAVALLTWESAGLPWVSIGLAVTWGFYGLFKKTLPIGPNQAFFLEVALLAPFALGYMIWLAAKGPGHFHFDGSLDFWLLLGCGPVTTAPLMLFANGAKLLRLSTIGMMQYIGPTFIFLIAVFVFREPFGVERAIAFGLIWAALIVYTWSAFFNRASATRPA